VAPLAATLLATVAVGVGVALARNGRPRRPSAPAPKPRFALLEGEPLAVGLRRAALEQADLAIAMLAVNGASPDEHAIHETRKAIKRLRAVVRLLRDALGEEAFARENAGLQAVAASLSGARDATVMLNTLDALLERHPRARRRRGVGKLRRRLATHRRGARASAGDPGTRANAAVELRAFRMRAAGWELHERKRMRLVEPGLQRIYAQGRRRGAKLRRRKRRSDAALHDWRKRVKDLRYASEVLQRASVGVKAKRLCRTAARADELGELLGEDHDLALLAVLIGGKRSGAKLPRATRKRLLKLIARRRRALQRRAMRLGERLYKQPPKRFARAARADFERQRQPAS
jgi:CHAD domain-containing protein